MKNRKFLACLSVVALAAAPVTIAGQSKPWTPPMTPDGRPDLQGVWLNISATPLERPKQLEGRQLLTDEEVAELKKRAARLFDINSNSDFAGGDSYFLGLLENADRFRNPNATGSVDRDGRERDRESHVAHRQPGGWARFHPLTAEGQQRLARSPTPNAAGQNRAAGPEDLSNAMRCITYGMPRLGVQNINAAGPLGYYHILQTPAASRSLPRSDPRGAHHSSGRTSPSAPDNAPVDGRLARPLGGQHAGCRDHQLFDEKPIHGLR